MGLQSVYEIVFFAVGHLVRAEHQVGVGDTSDPVMTLCFAADEAQYGRLLGEDLVELIGPRVEATRRADDEEFLDFAGCDHRGACGKRYGGFPAAGGGEVCRVKTLEAALYGI